MMLSTLSNARGYRFYDTPNQTLGMSKLTTAPHYIDTKWYKQKHADCTHDHDLPALKPRRAKG